MKKFFIAVSILCMLIVMTSCTTDVLKAANSGDIRAVEKAISVGGDINKRDDNGNTPLIIAAKHGDFGIVKTLIGKGAEIKAKNNDGYDALLALVNYSLSVPPTTVSGGQMREPIAITTEGHLKTAEYLITQGADVNAKTNDGNTALILAAQLNKKDLIELLLRKGADVNAVNQRGHTALIVAASMGQGEVVCPLVRYNADKNAKDSEGYTASQSAEKNGHQDIVEMLKNPCPAVSSPAVKESSDSSAIPLREKMVDDRLIGKLIDSLKDKDPSTRWDSARRLGEIKDKRATVPLINAMMDSHPYVRRRAAFSLGDIQDFRAVETLIKALNDEDPFVKKNALEALVKITGKKFGGESKQWEDWWNRKIRQN